MSVCSDGKLLAHNEVEGSDSHKLRSHRTER